MNDNIRYPRVMNPLWIVSLFITMTEAFVGYAVLNSTSSIQLLLSIFVIAFPVGVSTIFFIILWNRPEHLYAPRDYYSDTSFKDNLSRRKPNVRRDEEEATLKKAIKDTLTSHDFRTLIEKTKGKDLTELLSTTANDVFTVVKDTTSITIDLSDFSLDDFTIPYSSMSDFNDLTNEVYFALNYKVAPYTYGHSWILTHSEDGKPIKSARMIAGIGPGRMVHDRRSLEEIGIKPGTKLKANRL